MSRSLVTKHMVLNSKEAVFKCPHYFNRSNSIKCSHMLRTSQYFLLSPVLAFRSIASLVVAFFPPSYLEFIKRDVHREGS